MQSSYPLSKEARPDANLAPTIESPTSVFAQPQYELPNQSTRQGGVLHSPPITGLDIGTAGNAGADRNNPFVPSYTDQSVGPNDRFGVLENTFSGNLAMNNRHMHVGPQFGYPYVVRNYRHEISLRG
jgi:hypothetical protein